jgi:hypothetical protein
MKTLKLFAIGILFLSFTGCARSCESLDAGIQMTNKDIIVRQYSGGKLIFERKFHGMVNSSKESDGYYFTDDDTLFKLSGDVQILMQQ